MLAAPSSRARERRCHVGTRRSRTRPTGLGAPRHRSTRSGAGAAGAVVRRRRVDDRVVLVIGTFRKVGFLGMVQLAGAACADGGRRCKRPRLAGICVAEPGCLHGTCSCHHL